jgi:hypothetical protein
MKPRINVLMNGCWNHSDSLTSYTRGILVSISTNSDSREVHRLQKEWHLSSDSEFLSGLSRWKTHRNLKNIVQWRIDSNLCIICWLFNYKWNADMVRGTWRVSILRTSIRCESSCRSATFEYCSPLSLNSQRRSIATFSERSRRSVFQSASWSMNIRVARLYDFGICRFANCWKHDLILECVKTSSHWFIDRILAMSNWTNF